MSQKPMFIITMETANLYVRADIGNGLVFIFEKWGAFAHTMHPDDFCDMVDRVSAKRKAAKGEKR